MTQKPKDEPKDETTKRVKLTENIKYRGEYYTAGAVFDIQPGDYESLLKDGVIRTESNDDE